MPQTLDFTRTKINSNVKSENTVCKESEREVSPSKVVRTTERKAKDTRISDNAENKCSCHLSGNAFIFRTSVRLYLYQIFYSKRNVKQFVCVFFKVKRF